MAIARLETFLRKCFIRSRSEGIPDRWIVRLYANKGIGSQVSSGTIQASDSLESMISSSAIELENVMAEYTDGLGETCRFQVSITYKSDEGSILDEKEVATVFKVEPSATQDDKTGSQHTAALMRSQTEFQRVLLQGFEALTGQSVRMMDQLGTQLARANENQEKAISLIAAMAQDTNKHERMLFNAQRKAERDEKLIGLAAPHMGELVTGIKGLLGFGNEKKAKQEDFESQVKAFSATLSEEQRLKAEEIFGKAPVTSLTNGNMDAFVDAVEEEQLLTFAQVLDATQQMELLRLSNLYKEMK